MIHGSYIVIGIKKTLNIPNIPEAVSQKRADNTIPPTPKKEDKQ